MIMPIRFAHWCATALSLFFALSVFGLAVRASAQEYITFDAPFAENGTFPAGINDFGVITGYTNDGHFVSHSFVRTPDGKITTFQAPGADTNPADAEGTNATAINALGAITGYYGDSKGLIHGFLRSPEGKFATFEAPGASGYGTFPIGLNLEGAIVGYYTDSNFAFHAFLRNPDGTFATWIGPDECTGNGAEGCYGSAAFNINIFGITTGGYEDNSGNFVGHGLVRTPDGKLKPFNDPAAGTGSYQGTGCPGCASGINQWGAIAGTYIDTNSVQHGFLRSPNGTFTTFDAPGAGTAAFQGTGCSSDCPTSLNDLGAITGNYIDTNYVLHGYLRSPNGNIVTVDPAGSTATWSSGLNDFGAITGYYLDSNNVVHGFLRIQER